MNPSDVKSDYEEVPSAAMRKEAANDPELMKEVWDKLAKMEPKKQARIINSIVDDVMKIATEGFSKESTQ